MQARDFRMIALTLIDPPPKNTRTTFKKKSFAQLTRSVTEKGLIQPILVRPLGARFQIVAAERCFKAAYQAGLKEIPASVKDLSDEEALDAQLIENLQREDVHLRDEADGFLRIKNVSKEFVTSFQKRAGHTKVQGSFTCDLVGTTGFEPATSSTPRKRATRLRHVPYSNLPSS
jgi:ParB/RepB/Spo0J family partition protein